MLLTSTFDRPDGKSDISCGIERCVLHKVQSSYLLTLFYANKLALPVTFIHSLRHRPINHEGKK